MFQNPEAKSSKTALVTFLILLVAILLANIVMVAPYLLSIFMGGILALLSRPAYTWLRKKTIRPTLSAGIVCAGILFLIIGPLALFTAAAVDQAIEVGKNLTQSHGDLSFHSITEYAASWKPLRTIFGDAKTMETQLRDTIQKGGSFVSQRLLGIFGSLTDMLLQLVIALLSCFFLLIDGRRFYAWLKDRIPLDTDVREKCIDSFRNTAISAFLSTLAAAGIQSVIIFISFLILKIPGEFLATGATFLFAWVPLLGSTPVSVIGIIYLYTQGRIGAIVAMIIFSIIIGIADNVVRPLILKGRDETHTLVGLIAIFGGIAMFGLSGVFVGPILMSLLISLLQIWPIVGRRFDLLEDDIKIVQR